jgi:hypothetical protein
MFEDHMFDVYMLDVYMLDVYMFDVYMFEHDMFDDHMFGACGRVGEAIAGASMEKEAISGTAKAPAAAAPLSRVRLLGERGSRSSPEFSVLTYISSPFSLRQA